MSKQEITVVLSFFSFPVLLFTAHAQNDLVWTGAIPLLIGTVTFGFVCYGVGLLFLREPAKAAVLAAITAILTLQYTDIFDPLRTLLPSGPVDPRTLSFIVCPLLVLVALILIRRTSSAKAKKLTNYLAVIGSLLLALGIITTANNFLVNSKVDVSVNNEDLRKEGTKTLKEKPDVYYLVFDRYTGPIGLSESFGFDNRKFLKSLRDKGFYVADKSFSNYPVTYPSLASSLNAGELEVDGDPGEDAGYLPLQKMFRKPEVAAFLKKQDYSFVQVGSWWQNTNKSDYADRNPLTAWEVGLPFGKKVHVQYLSGTFLTGTLFGSFYQFHGGSNFSQDTKSGEIFLSQMNEVRRQARERSGPKFVFMHTLMPHPPLIFDSDGSRGFPPGLSDSEKFVRQTQFTNRQILALVDELLTANKENPPIIILAADEGEYPPGFKKPGFYKRGTDADFRRKTNILAAFSFPCRDYDSLYSSITPVNMFRVVFNEYFGTDLELQPDRTRISKESRLEWLDVTDRVHRTPGPPGSAVTKTKSSIGDF